jgi:hypothetical protein
MATRKRPQKPVNVVLAVDEEDGQKWQETHFESGDTVVLTPGVKTIPASIARVSITRAMVGHPDRVTLMRAVRAMAHGPEEPQPDTSGDE